MILAAGLSPAWQRIMVFDDFQPGEVNRAREVVNCASGKVLNVAIGLKHLKGGVHSLSSCGGQPASLMKSEFETLQIPATWIETAVPTRTCTTIIDRRTSQKLSEKGDRHPASWGRCGCGPQHPGASPLFRIAARITELVENAEPIGSTELRRWTDAFHSLANEATLFVLSGSLPGGVPSSLFAELLESHEVPAILDIRREELWAALPHKPLVIKPNREELAQTVSRPLESLSEIVTAAEELRDAGAEWVVVSDGENPLTVVGPDERFSVEVFPVENFVNPIGCGDSLTAGIAAAIHEGRSMQEAVRWGIACSAQNLQSLLPARLDYDTMLTMADSLTPQRIS